MHHALRWSILLTTGIAVGIAVATLMPPLESDQPAGSDKLYHVLAFGVLAFPLTTIRPRWSPWLFILFSAYGAVIELIQPYVGRSREVADLVADMAGVVCGMVLGLCASRALKAVDSVDPSLES